MDFDLVGEVRRYVRETQNILSSTQDVTVATNTLGSLSGLLPDIKCRQTAYFPETSIVAAKQEFCKHHYTRFCDFLLQQIHRDWFGKLTNVQKQHCFDVFFTHGVQHEAFLLLCKHVQETGFSLTFSRSVLLLENFIKGHKMASLILSQCRLTGSKNTPQSTIGNLLWDHLITVMATLPDRMANKLQRKTKNIFYPNNYFKILAKDTLTVLEVIYRGMKESRDWIISFISQLLGKICIQGHTDVYLGLILPKFIQLTQDDFAWRKICYSVFARIPENCLDCVVEYTLLTVPWYGMVSKIFGDSLLTNQKMAYIITQKCLFLRHYQKELILHNIIGYLAHSRNTQTLYIETLKTLFDVWGDGSALRHTSYEQHLYITKAILVGLGHINEGELRTYNKEAFIRKLMNGMQCHLDSAVMNVRRLGMIVAESLTQLINPAESQLKFEYQHDEETDLLLSLLTPPTDPGLKEIERVFSDFYLEEEYSHRQTNDNEQPMPDRRCVNGDELDSDDDIEPFDLAADTNIIKGKQPMYIRECMEGLLSQDEPDRVEACLNVAERLVRANPDNLSEVSVQFVKLLLHLQDNFTIDNFIFLRHSAMVAVAVFCPIQVCGYLTKEFYSRNYNIRQRMDILEVLASAAQELSDPSEIVKHEGDATVDRSNLAVSEGDDVNTPKHWRDIVQQRIDSKTRIFAKGPSKPEAVPVPNRFAAVAGHFFFPLLKTYDMSICTLNLLDQDHLLLGRLVYTLGVILHAAVNATCCHQMASSLLEFLWVIRYHTQAFVRQAILFALSMVILSVPSYLLVSTLQSDMLECRLWLQDVISKDPDTECNKLARQTLMILETVLKKELVGE